MATITQEMIQSFNERLSAIGSPWRIIRRDYDDARYFGETIAGSVTPSLAPFLVDHLTVDNGSDVQQMSVLRAEKTLKLQHTFSVKNALKLGTKATVEFNVLAVKVSAELSLEYTRDETTSETQEESVTLAFEQPVLIPPHTRATVQATTQLETVTDLPFELHMLLTDGRFAVTPKDIAPLYRYYDGTNHFYTRDSRVPPGYTSEGVACLVSNSPGPGLVRLLRYNKDAEHFYTTDPNEITTPDWTAEGDEGYVYAGAAPGAIPLYRYLNDIEHFYTTNYGELGGGRDGWRLEGIQAYVVPADVTDPALLRGVAELFPNAADRQFIIPGHYRGETTNRAIDVLIKTEPLPLAVRTSEPFVKHATDKELEQIAIFHREEAFVVTKPGELLDLSQLQPSLVGA